MSAVLQDLSAWDITPAAAQPIVAPLADNPDGYLAARGLSLEIAAKVGIRVITHAEADQRLNNAKSSASYYPNRLALWVPARGVNGAEHPVHGQVIRFNPHKKPFKCHTPTSLEYPNEVNYLIHKLEPGDTLYWCESTLKALILHHHFGLNAVGMNGVNGFSSGRQLVQSAKALPADLNHILLVDSINMVNKRSRTSVLNARRKWHQALRELGTARLIDLPPPPKTHPKADWGIDDFYVHKGATAVKQLLAHPVEFKEVSELKMLLDEFNSKFTYIKSVSKVYDRDANQLLTKQNFFDNYASVRINSDEGPKAFAPIWFNSVDRFELSGLGFNPDAGDIYDSKLNLWQGFGVQPAISSGDAGRYWVDTIKEALGEKEGKYFIELCAQVVQQPGKRISRYGFIYGKYGTGKNFIVAPMERIFGMHTQSWSVDNFVNNFNTGHYKCRLGILNEPGDPALLRKDVRDKLTELLKKNADQNERFMQLEPKGSDITTVERLQLNLIISNHEPPFDPRDRRALCLRMPQRMAIKADNNLGEKDADYWGCRWNWLNHEDGAAEVLNYLLSYDLRGVDMDGPAPMTAYKQELIGAMGDGNVKGFMEQLNVNFAGLLKDLEVKHPKEVDGTELPIIFDTEAVAALYYVVTGREVTNGFATQVGRLAQSVWECRPKHTTHRDKTTGKSVSLRVYELRNGRICSPLEKYDGAALYKALTEFKAALLPLK